ncbi:hypothetical protein CRUP_018440 [Coryphaenoides rupestris]|nr:hypothetical protein CRUP_018440 [Coryphaenoides rupestris]
MSTQRQQKPTLTGQRFKTRKRADVLNEESILKWYNEAHLAKGKSIFLEQMKKFVEWLKSAEEDEKERFDPTHFQESIVQGLNQTGTDLEAVAKFLDASGAKLDYRRYAETLFDILVAGGMLVSVTK